MKYEAKGYLIVDFIVRSIFQWESFSGIDEEMKTMPNIEKKIEQMDEYGDEIDFEDDDDEEIPDIGELLMEKYFSMSLDFF